MGIFLAFRAGLNGMSLGTSLDLHFILIVSISMETICSLSLHSLLSNKYLLRSHNEQRTDVRATGDICSDYRSNPFLKFLWGS